MSKKFNIIISKGADDPAERLASYIQTAISSGKSVLWMLSGGSAVGVAVLARSKISIKESSRQLHIALVDERFGHKGHIDSNWQQLENAGFDTNGLVTHPVLTDEGDITKTTVGYDKTLGDLIEVTDVVVGLFGVGLDGHTAGILPNSPIINSLHLVDHYLANDYNRISITPNVFEHIDFAVVYIQGEAKKIALEKLVNSTNTNDKPALLLKKAMCTEVYTNIKGVKI